MIFANRVTWVMSLLRIFLNFSFNFRYKTTTSRTIKMSGEPTGDTECHGYGNAGILSSESRIGIRILPQLREAG